MATTASESAVEVGLVPATSVLLPAAVPPVLQVPPLVATSVGLHTKKLTVPVGEPPAAVPVTTAWSVTLVPTGCAAVIGVVPTRGVVTVVDDAGVTVTSSPVSVQVALCDLLSVFGESPVYDAFQW